MCLCIPLSKQRRHVALHLKDIIGMGRDGCVEPDRTHTLSFPHVHECRAFKELSTDDMWTKVCLCMNHGWNGKPHSWTNALLIMLTGAVIWTSLKVTGVRVWGFLASFLKPWSWFLTGFIVYGLLYWSLRNLGLGPSLGTSSGGGCVTFQALVWSVLLLYNILGNGYGIYHYPITVQPRFLMMSCSQ